jgi:hypothetical protein
VVARAGALARLPIDPRRPHPGRHRRTGQGQVDAHAEVLVEHPGAVVPVGEHALPRPAISHDVVQPQLHEAGQGGPLGRRHVGVADVGGGVEHVDVGRRDVHVPAHHHRLRAPGDGVAQGGQPGELVAVVLGVRLAPVGHIHAVHAHAAAGGEHRAGLRVGEPGRAGKPRLHVLEAHTREDGHAVPLHLPVAGDRVATGGELTAEHQVEGLVRELRLLQAHDVGLAFIQPGQKPRHPLLGGVHVPAGDAHAAYASEPRGSSGQRVSARGWPLGSA